MKTLYLILFILICVSLSAQKSTTTMSQSNGTPEYIKAKNVIGGELQSCCFEPLTGYFRDGYCRTNYRDGGTHTVCAIVTAEFLDYTKSKGNDLSTPFPQFNFPGLKPGDKWCLCASRWLEAYYAGSAPKVVLEATHEKTLTIVGIEILKAHSVR